MISCVVGESTVFKVRPSLSSVELLDEVERLICTSVCSVFFGVRDWSSSVDCAIVIVAWAYDGC